MTIDPVLSAALAALILQLVHILRAWSAERFARKRLRYDDESADEENDAPGDGKP